MPILLTRSLWLENNHELHNLDFSGLPPYLENREIKRVGEMPGNLILAEMLRKCQDFVLEIATS